LPPWQRLRTQVAFRYLSSLLALGSNVAMGVIIARALGPTGKGEYQLILLVANLATTLSAFGLPASTLYHVAREGWHPWLTARAALVMACSILAAFTAALHCTRHYWSRLIGVPPEHAHWLTWLLLACQLLLLRRILGALLRSQHEIYHSSLGETFEVLGRLLLLVPIFLWVRAGVDSALTAWGVGVMLALGYTLWAVLARRWPARHERPKYGRLFTYSVQAQVTAVASTSLARADLLVVGNLMGAGGAGVYGIALGMGELLQGIPEAVRYVLLSRVAVDGPEAGTPVTRRAQRAVALYGLAGVLLMGPAALLIPAVYGEAFRAAIVPLWIMLPGYLCQALSMVLGSHFLATGRPGIPAAAIVAGTLAMIGLDFLLIPRMALVGGAIGSVAGYALTYAILRMAFRKMTRTADPTPA